MNLGALLHFGAAWCTSSPKWRTGHSLHDGMASVTLPALLPSTFIFLFSLYQQVYSLVDFLLFSFYTNLFLCNLTFEIIDFGLFLYTPHFNPLSHSFGSLASDHPSIRPSINLLDSRLHSPALLSLHSFRPHLTTSHINHITQRFKEKKETISSSQRTPIQEIEVWQSETLKGNRTITDSTFVLAGLILIHLPWTTHNQYIPRPWVNHLSSTTIPNQTRNTDNTATSPHIQTRLRTVCQCTITNSKSTTRIL